LIRKYDGIGVNEYIHRCEINREQWQDTSFIRTDVKQEFRERQQFGNRHAIFNTPQDEWGEVHYDEHNALDFSKWNHKSFGKIH